MTINEKHERLKQGLEGMGFFWSPIFTGDYDYEISLSSPFDYSESTDILLINSLSKNRNNMFKELQEKYYFSNISEEIRKKYKDILRPVILLLKNGKYVRAEFSIHSTLTCLAVKNNINYTEEEAVNSSKFSNLIKKGLAHKKVVIEDFEKKLQYSIFLNEALKMLDIEKEYFDEEFIRKNYLLLPIAINKIKKTIDDEMLLTDSLKKIEEQHIDFNEIKSCFDIDKFYLSFAKAAMVQSNIYSSIHKEPSPFFSQLYQYIHFVDELNYKEYNPRINYIKYENKRKKLVSYSFKDLKKDVEKYLKQYPNYSFKYISIFDPILDEENSNKELREIENEAIKYRYGEDLLELSESWEFIKKGKMEDKNITRSNYESNTNDENNSEVMDIDKKMEAFRKTDYLYKIVGREKFSGYVGYIYKNGVVAFEIFYDSKGRPIEDNNATYIMNIDNFKKMSSLSKPEIIEYIKTTDNNDVKRLYHNKTWENRLLNICSDKEYYSPEVREKIDALVATVKQKELNNK